MRFAVIGNRGHLIDDGRAIDIHEASQGALPCDAAALYHRWDDLRAWSRTVDFTDARPVADAEFQNPVPDPRQVFAVGANYHDHAAEAGAEPPAFPMIFTKFPESLSGPTDAIAVSTSRVDWEVELAVIMGRRAHRVSAAEAWDYVAGLTVAQDISERAIQLSGNHPQFAMGKSFPGFGPLGPVVVTPDEFDNPDDLELGCSLNGEVMQRSRTSQLVFSVGEIIAYISQICPMVPGDVVFTGTPAGVGAFRTPRVFLQPGDHLSTWVEGIGSLENPVVAGPPMEKFRS